MEATAAVISGAVVNGAAAQSQANAADPYDPYALAVDISAKLFADDGLARPIPDKPTVSDLAKGIDRALVLGGGGEYYVAWYCGFFHGLYELGVDLNIAEMVVGTSAGAYAGSSLTSGHFQRLRSRLETERASLNRWMPRLKRAFNTVLKTYQRIARLERQIAHLEE